MDIKKVGVFGTGLMGKGIIQVLGINGYEVIVFSRSNDAKARMAEYLNYEVHKERLQQEARDVIFKKLTFVEYTMAESAVLKRNLWLRHVADVDLIIESSNENKSIKKDLLVHLNSSCKKGALIATNTSTFSITELGACLNEPARFCGMHFFSPAPLMPLVELVKGLGTADETIRIFYDFIKSIGKEPVIVKDTPGFVLNRILLALILEAIRIVEEGTSTIENVDKVAVLGMNLKIGPLKLADLIGLDVVKVSIDNLFDEFKENKFRPSILLTNMVRAGHLGKKTGRGFYQYNTGKEQGVANLCAR